VLVRRKFNREEDLSPSSVFRRTKWLLKTLRNAREDPRSVFKERRPSRKFPNYMVLMSNIIDAKISSFEEVVD
jgi:hypothetical protein